MKTLKAKRKHVRRVYNADLKLIAVRARSKKPALKNWPERPFKTANDALRYLKTHPDTNFGVLTGDGLVVLDVDGAEGMRSLRTLIEQYGPLPRTVQVTTGNGQHIYFSVHGLHVRNSTGKIAPGLDIRGARGYVVLAGSRHPNGSIYRYKKGRALSDCRIAEMPAWLQKRLTAGTRRPPTLAKRIPKGLRSRAEAYFNRAREREHERLRHAPVHQRNDTLNRCAFKLGQLLHMTSCPDEKVLREVISIAHEIGLSEKEATATTRSGLNAGRAAPRPFPPSTSESKGKLRVVIRDKELTQNLAGLAETDADNAKRFVARFGKVAVYSSGQGWLIFDGQIWRRDQQKKRYSLAIRTAELIAKEAAHLSDDRAPSRRKFSVESKNKGALDRMLSLAETNLFIDDDNLDAFPDLLSVRNGTIDLLTGILHPHDSADLITNIVNVDYDPDAKAPRFMKFVGACMGGGRERIQFLKTAAGYTLTGHTREKALFFCHGPTDVGKSWFLLLLGDLLGTYAKTLPVEALVAKTYENIPNDLARLKGARFVSISEANHNRRFDEAKIKLITGGDRISARFLRKEFFDFVPTHKLWIAANDQPRVRASDGALWQRINVIPFTKDYDKPNKKLIDKLRRELPGILTWAVDGAKEWYRYGLPNCTDVRKATDRWRNAVNVTKQFFHECCEVAEGEEVSARDMYARFQKWCLENAETAISMKEFYGRLIELNLTPERTNKKRLWRNVMLVK